MSREPIEAEYRVTPEELQRAIERTGAKYVDDFASLYARVNAGLAELYEARIAERDLALSAKDETIATQREALAMQAETVAELRRRAEAAEAERDRLAAAQRPQESPGAVEAVGEAPARPVGTAGALVAGIGGRMRLIQEAADQELIWRQPSVFKEHYALRAGDEVLAMLHWKTAWGTLATARTAEGAWTFKRSGFWRPRIGVRPLGSEREVATFVPDWSGGGVLTVEGGRTFRWASKGIMGLEKLWQEHEGTPPLIGFKQVGSLKTQARVVLSLVAARLPEVVQLDDLYLPIPPEEMEPPSQPLVELPLLITLGFYLLVMAVRDNS